MACLAALVLASAATAATVRLTVRNNGKLVRAHVDDVIQVRLAENPSAGYGWTARGYDATFLRPISSKYIAAKAGRKVGVAGVRVCRFRVLRKGNVPLALKYVRVFEQKKKPAKLFAVQLSIT